MDLTILAHSKAACVGQWGWGEPLGIVTFMVGATLTLFLLALTIKTLASIDPEAKNKKRK